jgi:hypothetical protein
MAIPTVTLKVTQGELEELQHALDYVAVYGEQAGSLVPSDFDALRDRLLLKAIEIMTPDERASYEAEMRESGL